MHQAVAALLPLSLLPMAAASSFAVMPLLVIPAGVFIAPLLATRNELIGRVAPAGRAHGGLHLAGDRVRRRHRARLGARRVLVEGPGWRAAFVVAFAAAASVP